MAVININNMEILSEDIYNHYKKTNKHKTIGYLKSKTGCDNETAAQAVDQVLAEFEPPEIKAAKEAERKKAKKDKDYNLICPKCGSRYVKQESRGYTFLTGFIGAGTVYNICKNCRHKWKYKSMVK